MVSWRPRAGNLDIPIGILMFWDAQDQPDHIKKQICIGIQSIPLILMEFDERVPNSMRFRENWRFLKKFSEVSEIPTGSIWFHHKCCKCANRNDTMVSWRNRARNLDIPIGILMFLKCSGWPCPFYAPSMPLVRLLCPIYAPSMSTITHFQYFHQQSCKIPRSSMKSS